MGEKLRVEIKVDLKNIFHFIDSKISLIPLMGVLPINFYENLL